MYKIDDGEGWPHALVHGRTCNQILDVRYKADADRSKFSEAMKQNQFLRYMVDYKCEIPNSDQPGDVTLEWVSADRVFFIDG